MQKLGRCPKEETGSQNSITIYLLWYPPCPAYGSITPSGVNAEPWGEACSCSGGKTGLGDVPLSLLSSYLAQKSIQKGCEGPEGLNYCLSALRVPLTSLCLAGTQIVGHLLEEVKLEGLCLTMNMKRPCYSQHSHLWSSQPILSKLECIWAS